MTLHMIDRWHAAACELMPPQCGVFDSHCHTGSNDPDGFTSDAEGLTAALDAAGQQGAVICSMKEPGGYSKANQRVIAEAKASDDRLVAFARIDPSKEPLAEAEQCFDAGARGLKLHPRAEEFSLSEPAVERLAELAQERRAPVLIHAGRGMPALGKETLRLASKFPQASFILAHCGISDLSWITYESASHTNLFFDTAWWNITDLLALLAWIKPGQVLYASDVPYGSPKFSSTLALRAMCQVGYSEDQVASVMGGQITRLLQGEEPLDLGPALGEGKISLNLGLERAHSHILGAISKALAGCDPSESLGLATLALDVGQEMAHSDLYQTVEETVAEYESFEIARGVQREGIRSLMVAAAVCKTPDAGVTIQH